MNRSSYPVALDGIAVIANKKNDYAKCLLIEDLNKIWNPKSKGKITSWKQVNPQFPDKSLNLCAPASDTGAFDYFTQAVVGKAKANRTDYTPSHNQNVLVQGITGDEDALAYVGLSFYLANKDKLNLVAVKTPEGTCESPDPPSKIVKNIYKPLSRSLFIYVINPAMIETTFIQAA